MPPVSLAPVSVADGAFEYGEGGLSHNGFTRATPERLRELFGPDAESTEKWSRRQRQSKDQLSYNTR